jgi:hypothetical protein
MHPHPYSKRVGRKKVSTSEGGGTRARGPLSAWDGDDA